MIFIKADSKLYYFAFRVDGEQWNDCGSGEAALERFSVKEIARGAV